jgi:hypothetical protein
MEGSDMIRKVTIDKELVVVSPNEVGALNRISKALADRGIDVRAISAQAAGGVGLINFVVDEPLRAKDLLVRKGYKVQENNVLLAEVEDKPGVLVWLTKKLSAKKIDILNLYGSAPATYGPCVLVISTDNNQKSLVTLQK